MSRFSKALSIIPMPARVIAVLGYLITAGAFFAMFNFANDPGLQGMPPGVKVLLTAVIGIPLACWVLLIGYVNADAKRRGMRYVMWTLLAVFIPNAIGIIVYFILRDPLPRACPNCSQLVKPGFAYCPYCGYNIAPACPNCKRAVEPTWKICPTCGAALTGAPPAAAPAPPRYAGPQST